MTRKLGWMTVLVLSLLAGNAPVAAVPVPTGVRQDEEHIRKLIAQLGHENFRLRELAHKELDAIGEPALPLLAEAMKSMDKEVSQRATLLHQRIAKRAEIAKLLAPTIIELSFQDTPLPKALSEFSQKSGYSIVYGGGDIAKIAQRKITLETGRVPFWVALDMFCEKAELVEAPLPADLRLRRGAIEIQPLPGGNIQILPAPPAPPVPVPIQRLPMRGAKPIEAVPAIEENLPARPATPKPVERLPLQKVPLPVERVLPQAPKPVEPVPQEAPQPVERIRRKVPLPMEPMPQEAPQPVEPAPNAVRKLLPLKQVQADVVLEDPLPQPIAKPLPAPAVPIQAQPVPAKAVPIQVQPVPAPALPVPAEVQPLPAPAAPIQIQPLPAQAAPINRISASASPPMIVLIDGKPNPVPTHVEGAIRIRPRLPVLGGRPADERIELTLEARAEPKIETFNVVNVAVTQAIDAKNQELTPILAEKLDPIPQPGQPVNPAIPNRIVLRPMANQTGNAATVKLKKGQLVAPSLKEVRGHLAIELTIPSVLATVENLRKPNPPMAKGENEVQVKVIDVTAENDGTYTIRTEHSFPRDLQVDNGRVLRGENMIFVQNGGVIQIQNGPAIDGAVVDRSATNYMGLRVFDAHGGVYAVQRIKQSRTRIDARTRTHEVTIVWRPTLKDQGPPEKLTFSALRSVAADIPFVLKNIPLE